MRVALGLSAMLEGLWLRLMMGGDDISREKAHEAAVEHLTIVFPRHFPLQRASAPRVRTL